MLKSIPQCIILELPDTISERQHQRFWLSISNNFGQKVTGMLLLCNIWTFLQNLLACIYYDYTLIVCAEIKLLLSICMLFNLHWSCFQYADHRGMSVTRRIEATPMYISDQGNKVIYLFFVKQRCHKIESVYRNFNIYRIYWLVLNWYGSLSKYFYVSKYTHVNCRNPLFSTIRNPWWYERSSKKRNY